jgi:hypothetical protein
MRGKRRSSQSCNQSERSHGRSHSRTSQRSRRSRWNRGALTDGRLVPPQGSTSAVIDLTIDDPPSDKGKQKADVEMVDAPDRPGTSITSEDDMAEASARWPDFTGLVLAWAEEELPRWGRSTLEFRDTANPNAEPFFALDDKDEVQH